MHKSRYDKTDVLMRRILDVCLIRIFKACIYKKIQSLIE